MEGKQNNVDFKTICMTTCKYKFKMKQFRINKNTIRNE